MKIKLKSLSVLFCFIITVFYACTKDEELITDDHKGSTTSQPVDTTKPFKPTPYLVPIPFGLPPMPPSFDNPITVEGVDLGRKLFFETLLSKNNTMSCGSCHNQQFGFTDNGKQFSNGLSGQVGFRNAMPLFNLAWVQRFAQTDHRFFWDGSAADLESQVLGPITNPIEMDETLANVVQKIQAHPQYPALFKKAFGTDSVTTKRLIQAIAQFERTIVSANTRFDRFRVIQEETLTEQEKRGMDLFNAEDKADCFHCHNLSSPFSSDFQFHNNGHQGTDQGLMRVTNNPGDLGKFRTATLRNLVFTAPYMHDGRFNTLEEVVEFYNSGAIRTIPADPFITKHPAGLGLTTDEKADLVAFLKTLTDSSLLTNTFYQP